MPDQTQTLASTMVTIPSSVGQLTLGVVPAEHGVPTSEAASEKDVWNLPTLALGEHCHIIGEHLGIDLATVLGFLDDLPHGAS
jgi:hypothetical protein